MAQNIEQMTVAEPYQLWIFSLVQSIGIDKEWTPFDSLEAFTDIFQVRPQTYRSI